VNDNEQRHVQKLLHGLEQVDGWRARINPDGPRSAPPDGSPLKADNNRTAPYQLGHAAWHAISHAVDHLHCLHALITDAQLLNMYAPYTLVRAALENASAAVWLLAPASRSDRITRRLRLAALDAG
jgi:hypothetical protein